MQISCAASVQAPFARGTAMLHSFWYEEARRQFIAVAKADPPCAMAQWGLTMQGWQSWAHHQDADALVELSAAADEQDRAGQAEVDIPAREMYADMLLGDGKADALAQYKTDMRLSLNRFNGLAGAMEAAKAAGKPGEVRAYSAQLLKITNGASASTRPQIAQARQMLHSSTGASKTADSTPKSAHTPDTARLN